MRLSYSLTSAFLLTLLSSSPISAKEAEPLKPCTAKSSTTHSLFDLSPLALKVDDKKTAKEEKLESWHAKGFDYGANFTLNICDPVVEELKHVEGLHTKEARNVSAYYQKGGKTYSLGSMNTAPMFRGRRLVLNYTEGSPCTNDDDDDDDEDGPINKKPKHSKLRRKSTMISFLCDRDPQAPKATVSFVGSPDNCAYFFEVRAPAACGGVPQASDAGGVGPAGVFGLIVLITLAAYILGGVAYQRTVMHQRGWKQLPNYSTWAGIGNFIKDFSIIIFSTCASWIPSRRGGYNQLPVYSDRSRFSRNEDENRLIDQLDEEWDE